MSETGNDPMHNEDNINATMGTNYTVSSDDDEEVYEVDKILNFKMKGGKRTFLVRWKGYGSDQDSWEPEENLGGAQDAVTLFLENNSVKKSKEGSSKKAKASKRASTSSNPKPKKSKCSPAESDDDKNKSTTSMKKREESDESSSDEDENEDFITVKKKKKKKTEKKKKSESKSTEKTRAKGGASSNQTSKSDSRSTLEKAVNQRKMLNTTNSSLAWLDSDVSDSDKDNDRKSGTENGKEYMPNKAALSSLIINSVSKTTTVTTVDTAITNCTMETPPADPGFDDVETLQIRSNEDDEEPISEHDLLSQRSPQKPETSKAKRSKNDKKEKRDKNESPARHAVPYGRTNKIKFVLHGMLRDTDGKLLIVGKKEEGTGNPSSYKIDDELETELSAFVCDKLVNSGLMDE